jgi:hypothetical protein
VRAAVVLALFGCGCGDDAAPAVDAAPPDAARWVRPDALCVFDYDLTLSSNVCAEAEGQPDLHCRVNTCITYSWYAQCLGVNAREAVAECVARGAAIGIASHASADLCWDDKIVPILTESQFPEWTGSPRYGAGADPEAWSYPPLDDRSRWNCDDCAYTMDGNLGKPDSVARVMRHYGLDPASPTDRTHVIFWDDSPTNVARMAEAMPEVHTIQVPRLGAHGADGGCGITQAEIDAGWAAWEASR